MKKGIGLLVLLGGAMAWAGEVALKEEAGGWQLQVDGEPYYVKGFTWSHTPVGKKYDYDLFAENKEFIEAALKRDFTLIREAGGNTIRHIVPPERMKMIHETYGLSFIANDYCGRYGLEIDGQFVPHIDYSDGKTRELIKSRWRELAKTYRDVPGLLMHALGNENNYGLEWKSAAVENLPEGERHRAKAKYLYSLFNEIALEVKAIDPNHPVGIVNGDLQYLDLIAELCPDIDYLGVNAYRGKDYSDLFDRVKAELGKPVLLMETGCDAFNAVEQREEEYWQARMIHDNWIDLYRNTAANGGAGNCIGGMAFQWADEWWKMGQQYNLDIHDTKASWHHGGYQFDAAAGENMNEEWFGVCAIYPQAAEGAHIIRPRAAYFALKDLWKEDPYQLGKEGLAVLSFDEGAVMNRSVEAAKKVKEQVEEAGVVFHTAGKLEIPAVVYQEAGEKLNWIPSGVMPAVNFLKVEQACRENPHSGETCLRIDYTSGGDWSGLVWQHPVNDWENNSPGGFDLTGAAALKFQARGGKGGEKMKISFGGPLTGLYPNTSHVDERVIELGTEWKEYRIPLSGKDLRRVKNPLTLVFEGNGFPYQVYLDEIVFE